MLLNGLDNPRKLPLPLRGSASLSNTWFREPTPVYIQTGILIGSAAFALLTVQCPITLQWAATFPPKLPLPLRGSARSSNTWYLWSTRVIIQNGISIGLAVFVLVPNALL